MIKNPVVTEDNPKLKCNRCKDIIQYRGGIALLTCSCKRIGVDEGRILGFPEDYKLVI